VAESVRRHWVGCHPPRATRRPVRGDRLRHRSPTPRSDRRAGFADRSGEAGAVGRIGHEVSRSTNARSNACAVARPRRPRARRQTPTLAGCFTNARPTRRRDVTHAARGTSAIAARNSAPPSVGDVARTRDHRDHVGAHRRALVPRVHRSWRLVVLRRAATTTERPVRGSWNHDKSSASAPPHNNDRDG